MKVRFEFDVSPRELRQLLGLPDVEQLQREVIDAIRQRMAAGVEGFDPLSLLRSFFSLAQSFPGFDTLLGVLGQAAARAAGGSGGSRG